MLMSPIKIKKKVHRNEIKGSSFSLSSVIGETEIKGKMPEALAKRFADFNSRGFVLHQPIPKKKKSSMDRDMIKEKKIVKPAYGAAKNPFTGAAIVAPKNVITPDVKRSVDAKRSNQNIEILAYETPRKCMMEDVIMESPCE